MDITLNMFLNTLELFPGYIICIIINIYAIHAVLNTVGKYVLHSMHSISIFSKILVLNENTNAFWM